MREVNGDNVADVDLRVRTNDCNEPFTILKGDTSFDYKSMVYLPGALAAGESLCVGLLADHVPPGPTRTVQLVIYFSGDTELR